MDKGLVRSNEGIGQRIDECGSARWKEWRMIGLLKGSM